MNTVTWADEQLVAAAWVAAGTPIASLIAAIVVGVFVARTFTATQESAVAAKAAAAAAAQQAESSEAALQHEREATTANERRMERVRIDERMPTVTIQVEPSRTTALMTSATVDSVYGQRTQVWKSNPMFKALPIDRDTRILLESDGQRDEHLLFRERVAMTFTNHSDQPARVEFVDMVLESIQVGDGRELLPMYLAPTEEVTVFYTRQRALAQIADPHAAAQFDALMLRWRVGDIRQDASDLYSAHFGMAFYELDGAELRVTARPRNSLSRSVVAIPTDRVYLRDAKAE